MWKYLIVGSVGIASHSWGLSSSRTALAAGLAPDAPFEDFCARALLSPVASLRVRTALHRLRHEDGLAPMHTWKPDAYGEAPGIVGALLAGGLTSFAFLAILRFYQICQRGR